MCTLSNQSYDEIVPCFLLADLESMSLNYLYLFSFTCPALKDKVDKAHSCLSVCLSFPYVRNALEGMDLLGCYKRYTAQFFYEVSF